MRIVHVIDHFQPWMGYQETYLAREQAALGHDVTVVTSNRYTRVAADLRGQRIVAAGSAVEHGIRVVRLPVVVETPTRAGYVWMRHLGRTLRALAPDVVHCHGVLTMTALQSAQLKERLGYRLIFDNHMADFNVYWSAESTWKTRLKRWGYPALGRMLNRLILPHADAIVAIGEPERDFVRSLFGRACPLVPVIRLGADDRLFTFQPEERARIRRERGWADGDVVLGHAGTVRPSKNVHLLIQAAGALRQCGEPVRVAILGRVPDDYRAVLEAEVARAQLGDRLSFEDFVPVERLPAHLSAMDIAVWPGDISNTAIEAMAVGLPVVALRTSYTESVIEKYGAGVLVDRADSAALAAALFPLVHDAAERQCRAERARAAVAQDLNWTTIARQFLDLYAGDRSRIAG